ncbi:hypothetical protein AAC387_Pa12g0849 [Persea americana]
MATEELNKRRRKGLSYKCNEKFCSGHHCKKLFLIQASLEESDEDVEMEIEEAAEEAKEEVPQVSLHTIAGTRAPETTRVTGSLGHKGVMVLIDFGSTHNFVCEWLA